VQVLIPAAYPLTQEKAIVIHDFSGKHGTEISHRVLTNLQQHLPSLVIYQQTPTTEPEHIVHLYGQIEQYFVGKPEMQWDDYDEESHIQTGSVYRDLGLKFSVRLENTQHQVLWSKSMTHTLHVQRTFSIYSDEAYQELDAGSHLIQGQLLDSIADTMTENNMEQDASEVLPPLSESWNNLINDVSIIIAQQFYDRYEQHLQWR